MSRARGPPRAATNGRVPIGAGGAGRRGAATHTTKDPERGDAVLRPDGCRPVAGDKRVGVRRPVGPVCQVTATVKGVDGWAPGWLFAAVPGAGPGSTCQVSTPPVPLPINHRICHRYNYNPAQILV